MKFNNKTVLIVPLDWGLGHATRCIPIVQALLAAESRVIIAASAAGVPLLRQEFPQLQVIEIPGYNVRYASRRWMLPFSIGFQVPKILKAIAREQHWLQVAIRQYNIDLVISDNRYGLYSDAVPCIFLTHQLRIKAPFRWMEDWLQKINWGYISRFTECWVPDEAMNGLAGELSHPASLHPFPIRYIGILSRFSRKLAPVLYHAVVLISGPEPQRSIFEKKILGGLKKASGRILIVRGKPGSDERLTVPANVQVVNHLEGRELEQALNSTEYVICRAGYSSIMELASLNKQPILVPTPGQTEQEYLGPYLQSQQFAVSIPQNDFELSTALEQAAAFTFRTFPHYECQLADALDGFFATHFPSPANAVIS